MVSDACEASVVGSSGLVPIAVDTLCPTALLDFDLYVRLSAGGGAFLYRESSYPLDQDDLDRLVTQGVHTLYIPSAKCPTYQKYLRDVVVKNERLPPVQRFSVLKKANRAIFESAFRSGLPERMVQFAGEFGSQVTDVVCRHDTVLLSLFEVMDHDYYTYTHLTNVCAYTVALADGLGIHSAAEVDSIAAGALLHDYGKRHVPPALLNKPGRLSPDERDIMRQHVAIGFEELCGRHDVDWNQLMMVYQHHERINGRGYPVGSVGDEIHPWAKLCAIADVFDALTSARPYRRADTLEHVREYLWDRAGEDFDREIVRCWVTRLRVVN